LFKALQTIQNLDKKVPLKKAFIVTLAFYFLVKEEKNKYSNKYLFL